LTGTKFYLRIAVDKIKYIPYILRIFQGRSNLLSEQEAVVAQSLFLPDFSIPV
jgi:hypothetical protein